jgi:hypothetical protein
MRRLLLVLAALPLLGAVSPAGAAPNGFAGEVRSASTTFQLGGRDGRTWLVGLTLDEVRPLRGAISRSLVLSLQPCTTDRHHKAHCAATKTYRAALAEGSGAVRDDLRSAYVRTRIAGARIDLAWTVDVPAGISSIAHVDGDEGVVEVRNAQQEGGSGPVAGIVLGPRCRTTGEVAGAYVVRRNGLPQPGDEPPSSLPAPLLPSHGWTPRCV